MTLLSRPTFAHDRRRSVGRLRIGSKNDSGERLAGEERVVIGRGALEQRQRARLVAEPEIDARRGGAGAARLADLRLERRSPDRRRPARVAGLGICIS